MPGVEKEQPRTKKALACQKRCEIKMGGQGLLLLIELKILIIMTSHCYFGCSRSPDVDGIINFDQKNCIFLD